MRTIIAVESVSLDGVLQAPGRPEEDERGGFAHGGWAAPYGADPEQGRIMGRHLSRPGDILLGRRTYEDFHRVWAGRTDNPFSPVLDARRKYVVSGTLTKDGAPVIKTADIVADIYPQADPDVAPDLILGYHDGYRASWETVLGEMPAELLADNLDRWSGTHLNAAELVPGILLSNRPILVDDPAVSDIAPTVLGVFGIPKPTQMTGRALLADAPGPRGAK